MLLEIQHGGQGCIKLELLKPDALDHLFVHGKFCLSYEKQIGLTVCPSVRWPSLSSLSVRLSLCLAVLLKDPS